MTTTGDDGDNNDDFDDDQTGYRRCCCLALLTIYVSLRSLTEQPAAAHPAGLATTVAGHWISQAELVAIKYGARSLRDRPTTINFTPALTPLTEARTEGLSLTILLASPRTPSATNFP